MVELVEFGWLKERGREVSYLDIESLPTLKMRNILMMLREMREHCRRVKIQV